VAASVAGRPLAAGGIKSFVFSEELFGTATALSPVRHQPSSKGNRSVRTSKLLLALILCLASVSAFAQITDTYVVTAAANAPGQNNTRWLTQLSIFNPHFDYPLTVSVTLLRTGGAPGEEKLIEIPANGVFISDNAMVDVFNSSGTGSLLLAAFTEDNPQLPDNEVISRAFLVSSNTYNNAEGTYGQTIPGVWTGLLDFDYDGITSVAHGIDNSSRLEFRTNVGVVNLGRCGITVRVSVYDADGFEVIKDAPFGVPPLAHWQERLPVTVEGGSVEFLVQDPCWDDADDYAVVFPYTSTVDNISGDPRYQTPSLLASPGLIFGKKGKAAANADPTQVGKKIDSAYARKVRASVQRTGKVQLMRGERGWIVAK
jgi:hypothetical protein